MEMMMKIMKLSVNGEFKIDLIVWKFKTISQWKMQTEQFKIDLIVWK